MASKLIAIFAVLCAAQGLNAGFSRPSRSLPGRFTSSIKNAFGKPEQTEEEKIYWKTVQDCMKAQRSRFEDLYESIAQRVETAGIDHQNQIEAEVGHEIFLKVQDELERTAKTIRDVPVQVAKLVDEGKIREARNFGKGAKLDIIRHLREVESILNQGYETKDSWAVEEDPELVKKVHEFGIDLLRELGAGVEAIKNDGKKCFNEKMGAVCFSVQ